MNNCLGYVNLIIDIGRKIENALYDRWFKRANLTKALGIKTKELAYIIEKDDLNSLSLGLLNSIALIFELPLLYFIAETNNNNSTNQSCGDNGVNIGVNDGRHK